MALEFSLAYFMPILAFLLVITLVYALLAKTKVLGENTSINFLVSFAIAMIFLVAPMARAYTLKITPWLAVLIVILFFFVLIISFTGNAGILKSKWIGIAVVIILLALLVVSGINIFGSLVNHYLSFIGLSFGSIKDTILQPSIMGIIVLIIISAVLFFFLKGK